MKVIADWEKSGSGRGQVVETDSDYEFIEGDDRKAFLRERPPHVLYLWHLAKTYGILQTVRQQLTAENSVDGNSVPSVASSRKRKATSEETETHKQLGNNIREMTQSIQGLVTIATVEILYRRREKLEEVLRSLDSMIIDYELKLVEDELSSSRRSIFERALHKKQTEYDTVKRELADIVKAIEEKEQTQSQPRNLFNVTDDVDVSSVSDSVKASGCTTPMADKS